MGGGRGRGGYRKNVKMSRKEVFLQSCNRKGIFNGGGGGGATRRTVQERDCPMGRAIIWEELCSQRTVLHRESWR